MEKTYKAALVTIPPDDCFQQIQVIRRDHDKAYERWMPHINLLYPFLDDKVHKYNQIAQTLVKGLTDFKPFTVRFTKESFGHFAHGRRSTVWLKPLPAVPEQPIPQPLSTGRSQSTEKTSMSTAPSVTSGSVGPKSVSAQSGKLKSVSPVITSPVAPYINHQYMWDVSIDHLADAVWTPESTKKVDVEKPPKLEAGLDCLRYAIWTPENTNSELITVKPTTRLDVKTVGGTGLTFGSAGLTEGGPGLTALTSRSHAVEEFTQDDSDAGVSDSEEWTVVKPKEKKPPTEPKATPTFTYSAPDEEEDTGAFVENLQAKLESMFPECNDLSSKSPEGFRPHLTLGQCDTNKVEQFIKKLKSKWRDIEFKVDSVYLITRSQEKPFEIYKTIPLNISF